MSYSKAETMMSEYRNLDALVLAYREKCELDGMSQDGAKIHAQSAYKYVPHLYRGGYVIPGFGYSTERESQGRIQKGKAGNPYDVR